MPTFEAQNKGLSWCQRSECAPVGWGRHRLNAFRLRFSNLWDLPVKFPLFFFKWEPGVQILSASENFSLT